MKEELAALASMNATIAALARACPTFWVNPEKLPFSEAKKNFALGSADIRAADARMERFAPFVAARFPETAVSGGRIVSPLTEIPRMSASLGVRGRMFLKQDNALAVAGSVKARGGIYEVLCHTEDLIRQNGLLPEGASYEGILNRRAFFSRYRVQVGSTGNLGLSIGIMSAAIGYRAAVHMSADAKAWKKALLRQNGVEVLEYDDDYEQAVKEGRRRSDADPASYFVDDEHSERLFLGYATAAEELARDLARAGVAVDTAHPLFVYLPCGVGGAPGGVTFGLKLLYGDDVHCVFVEPTQAPAMILGLCSGLGSAVCARDLGLSGKTEADGLAVGRPSPLVSEYMRHVIDAACTVADDALYRFMAMLETQEGIFLEPSACAGFWGALRAHEVASLCSTAQAAHVVWATGGSLVPEEIRRAYRAHAARVSND